jgi:hypothetical protein
MIWRPWQRCAAPKSRPPAKSPKNRRRQGNKQRKKERKKERKGERESQGSIDRLIRTSSDQSQQDGKGDQ